MSTTHPVADRNLDGYGTPAIEWQRVLSELERRYTQAPDTGGPNRHTTWLATTNTDGTPHVMPVGSGWVDGGFWFTSGPGTRKSRNLADTRLASSRCRRTSSIWWPRGTPCG
jgi:Pyridoxamine 5'-phosphate oxidase